MILRIERNIFVYSCEVLSLDLILKALNLADVLLK